jgi:hypothetical protein
MRSAVLPTHLLVFTVILSSVVLHAQQGVPVPARPAPPPVAVPEPVYGAPETPVPAFAKPANISTTAENQKYLGAWTSYWTGTQWTTWDGTKDIDIVPNNPLMGFGPAMCALLKMCSPLDKQCDAKGNCQPATCGAGCPSNPARQIYIIHIVDWFDPVLDPATSADVLGKDSVKYKGSHWYFYKTDVYGHYQILIPTINSDGSYTLPDIYDIDNGYVISVSRLTANAADKALMPPDISYTPTITLNTATWLAGLETLAGGFTGLSIPATSGAAAKGAGGGGPPPTLVYSARIKVQQISVNKIQRPFSVAIAASASAQNSDTLDCRALGTQSSCAFQTTVPVLQRSFVSFGVNIVPYGPTEATWAVPTGSTTLTPTVSHHNAFYGVVDFTPVPAKWPMYKRPYVQAGLPFTGKAWNLPYVGAAYPIYFSWFKKNLPISAFAGMVFMKQQGPHPMPDRVTRFMWGFEVPIAAFSKAINQATGDKKSKGN